ncbi:MAG: LacI family DNA-binding transcriptional regulator [bacterium]
MNMPPRRRATIHDVAQACGVAPSTVSNALSNARYVAEDTREKVLRAAADLGYRASTVARSLRLQRSWSLGLLVANIVNPFYPEIVRGAEDAAAEENCNVILCNTDYRRDKQDRYIDVLVDRQVDGLVLASHPDESHVRYLTDTGLPLVLVNRGRNCCPTDYVGVENHQGTQAAIDFLVGIGHRRIGFIRGHAESSAAEERFAGYLGALAAHGLPADPGLTVEGAYDVASGEAGAGRLLALAEPPTAILAASDLMALGAMEAIARHGLSVPEHISVVGFDDIFLAAMPGIGLTTMRVPKWDLGATATKLLLDRIAGREQGQAREILYPTELVVRRTAAPPRSA